MPLERGALQISLVGEFCGKFCCPQGRVRLLVTSFVANIEHYSRKISLECMVKEQSSRIYSLQALETQLTALKEKWVAPSHRSLQANLYCSKIILECEAKENRSTIAVLQRLEPELAAAKQEYVHRLT